MNITWLWASVKYIKGYSYYRTKNNNGVSGIVSLCPFTSFTENRKISGVGQFHDETMVLPGTVKQCIFAPRKFHKSYNPNLVGILIPNSMKVTVYKKMDQWSGTMP